MSTGIHIGNNVDKEHTGNVVEALINIMKVGSETRMDQSTIVKAFEVITDVSTVENVTVSECIINPPVIPDQAEPPGI